MLGVRIDADLEAKLEALSRLTRRSKSEVAREAIRRYVEAHDIAEEARRQSRLASAVGAEPEATFDDTGWTP